MIICRKITNHLEQEVMIHVFNQNMRSARKAIISKVNLPSRWQSNFKPFRAIYATLIRRHDRRWFVHLFTRRHPIATVYLYYYCLKAHCLRIDWFAVRTRTSWGRCQIHIQYTHRNGLEKSYRTVIGLICKTYISN